MKPLLGIEGFNYEEGYKYKLTVKKIIQAEPYSVSYILVDMISKEQVWKIIGFSKHHFYSDNQILV